MACTRDLEMFEDFESVNESDGRNNILVCDEGTERPEDEALRTFIEQFELSPELWNCANHKYINKTARIAALDNLIPFLVRIKPEAKREDVNNKINSLRTNFRKELKKIAASKRSGKSPDEVYKPTAWTFYALSFLERFEEPVEQQPIEAEAEESVMTNYLAMETSDSVPRVLTVLKDVLIFFVLLVYHVCETVVHTVLDALGLRSLKELQGQVALVTGGGSGVGRLLCIRLARLGCKVVVWDINKEGLSRTCDMIKAEGLVAHGYVCDVSDRAEVYRIGKTVKEEVGVVTVLVNNAGIVYGRPLLELPDTAIEATYKVNTLAHYWTVKAFLPDMIDRKQGHVVTVGSVAGIMGTYLCTDYCATKAANIAFHEALLTELRLHGHDFIKMSLVCPYLINTGMFHGITSWLHPILEPEYVADSIVQAIQTDKVQTILPNNLRLFFPIKYLLPSKSAYEAIFRVVKGPQIMSMFKGRPRVAAG